MGNPSRHRWSAPARDKALHRFGEIAIGKHHMAVAGETAQANIRAIAVDAPLITPTGVRLAGLDDVVDLNFERVIWHGSPI